MSPQPSTSTRYEEMDRIATYEQLARNPEAQAEAIALHYASRANYARDLLEIIRLQRMGCTSSEQVDSAAQVIAMMVADIKSAHRRELGIELEWPIANPRA